MAIDFSKKSTATVIYTRRDNPSIIVGGQSKEYKVHNYYDYTWTPSGTGLNQRFWSNSIPADLTNEMLVELLTFENIASHSNDSGKWFNMEIFSGGQKIFTHRDGIFTQYVDWIPASGFSFSNTITGASSSFNRNQQDRTNPTTQREPYYVHLGTDNKVYFYNTFVRKDNDLYIASLSKADPNSDTMQIVLYTANNNFKCTGDIETTPSYLDQNIAESGGATGNFDNTSDEVDFPDDTYTGLVSTINQVGSLMNVYHISAGTLKDYSEYVWSDGFIDNINKYFNSPSDATSGLFVLPFSVTDTTQENIAIGNMKSNLIGNKVNQFKWIDCGSYDLSEYWGNFADYSATKVSLYLPFVGIMPIQTSYYMSKTISVRYKVDCFTGAFVCFVKAGNNVLTTFNGTMAYEMPTSSASYSALSSSLRIVGGATAMAVGIGSAVMTGGASLGALGAIAGGGGTIISSLFNMGHTNIQNSGNYTGNVGIMGYMKPYLIIERVIQQTPSTYQHDYGFPSFITSRLGALKGFTKMKQIHLEHVVATEEEKAMIESLLKEGVIL